jgi:hypothetical protein
MNYIAYDGNNIKKIDNSDDTSLEEYIVKSLLSSSSKVVGIMLNDKSRQKKIFQDIQDFFNKEIDVDEVEIKIAGSWFISVSSDNEYTPSFDIIIYDDLVNPENY